MASKKTLMKGMMNLTKPNTAIPLSTQLANQLSKLKSFKVEEDQFIDGSSRWVNIQKGELILEISFDISGENITEIQIFKGTIELTDVTQIM